jgi:DNA helicase-2/ATP-dependent DNA helicase PcrA
MKSNFATASSASDEKIELNNSQQAVIEHVFGPIRVLAPVGTGKTLVLAERVAKAIGKGVNPRTILCLTFTNRAAEEMKERVHRYFPDLIRDLTIKTFHALCAHILRLESRNIGLPQDFVIYDEIDSIELIKDIFRINAENDAKDILWAISECKTNAGGNRLSLDCAPEDLFESLRVLPVDKLCIYQNSLRERHALDFADLVFSARAILNNETKIRERWEDRYHFVQVDEIQDTHFSEYDIVQILARKYKNIAIIGDIDQTIYEWRGSDPFSILDKFDNDFSPEKYELRENYRATRILLEACSSFAESFHTRHTRIIPSERCEHGEPIIVHTAHNAENEGDWIAQQIKFLSRESTNFSFNRTAVLGRTNKRAQVISERLELQSIPCYTVEQYDFFRRQEIKDALAYLRVLLHPVDTGSMQRILIRPPHGIGEGAIKDITEEGQSCALRLSDMVALPTLQYGDPFGLLFERLYAGSIVVIDVETTGISIDEDEIVEVAATRLLRGEVVGKYDALILNKKPVGDSERIHGLTDEYLKQHGRPANEVFSNLFDFVRDSLLVGYNISFDTKIILSHARRSGVPTTDFIYEDVLPIARRCISGVENYRLETVARSLDIIEEHAHTAIGDVVTTIEVLKKLVPTLTGTALKRQQIVGRYVLYFKPLALQIDSWKAAARNLRPAETLRVVLQESGLRDYYQKRNELKRLIHLSQLERIFQARDDPRKQPEEALSSIAEFVALAKNVDYFSRDENKVPIITIHQAKGLEFDNVFLSGVCQNEIPHFFSVRDGKEEEEKRLFYVALTRAKKRLFISMHLNDEYGRYRSSSPYISLINKQCMKKV